MKIMTTKMKIAVIIIEMLVTLMAAPEPPPPALNTPAECGLRLSVMGQLFSDFGDEEGNEIERSRGGDC